MPRSTHPLRAPESGSARIGWPATSAKPAIAAGSARSRSSRDHTTIDASRPCLYRGKDLPQGMRVGPVRAAGPRHPRSAVSAPAVRYLQSRPPARADRAARSSGGPHRGARPGLSSTPGRRACESNTGARRRRRACPPRRTISPPFRTGRTGRSPGRRRRRAAPAGGRPSAPATALAPGAPRGHAGGKLGGRGLRKCRRQPRSAATPSPAQGRRSRRSARRCETSSAAPARARARARAAPNASRARYRRRSCRSGRARRRTPAGASGCRWRRSSCGDGRATIVVVACPPPRFHAHHRRELAAGGRGARRTLPHAAPRHPRPRRRRRPRRPIDFEAASPDVADAARASASRWPDTPWAGGLPCGWRSRIPNGSSQLVLVGRDGRDRRPRSSAALGARRTSSWRGRKSRVRRSTTSRADGSAGRSSGPALRGAWRRPRGGIVCGNTPARLAAALRGLGTGAMEPLWARLDRLGMPVTVIVGRARLEVPQARRRIAEVADPTPRRRAREPVMPCTWSAGLVAARSPGRNTGARLGALLTPVSSHATSGRGAAAAGSSLLVHAPRAAAALCRQRHIAPAPAAAPAAALPATGLTAAPARSARRSSRLPGGASSARGPIAPPHPPRRGWRA